MKEEARALNENSTDYRDALMRAQSAAEHLTAAAPIGKYDSVTTSATEVSLHLADRPEDVARYGRKSGMSVQLALRSDGRPLLEASGEINGVPVRVWSLGQVEDEERYRALAPASPLPAAWSVKQVAA